jgi:16S rRNA (cytidine1402-2'-O)-methyltransferase
MSGRIFMVPNNISDNRDLPFPEHQWEQIKQVKLWIGETPKACMRMISKLAPEVETECFFPVKNPLTEEEQQQLLFRVKQGEDLAIISDAGCPGIADPGSQWVLQAHQWQIPVIPLTGPCSFLLALMASGLNGQHFTFHGYLPRENKAMTEKIRVMERTLRLEGSTHIFMEAPHRNEGLFQSLLQHCAPDTLLHISCNLQQHGAWSKTLRIDQWKSTKTHIQKKEVVFILGKGIK